MRDKPNPQPTRSLRGFTLVEMLVATGLVVLMMLLFAQIFQTSAGLISNQKRMAEHDQNVRTLTILLRGDMKSRTFVDVVPFQAGQNTDPSVTILSGPNYVADRRKGFISISENDPEDTTDDVLHLTITSDPLTKESNTGSPALPFSGRTSLMFNGNVPADQNAENTYLQAHPDQPEFDDGQLTSNATGNSRYAEVCWFLRNGNLYRRQLLIREPYSRKGNMGEEPKDSSVTTAPMEFIATTYTGEEHVPTTNPNGVFWRDFDYSAYWEPDTQMLGTGYGLKFHTVDSLDNLSNSPGVPNLLGFPRSLGIPFLRYGSSTSRVFTGPTQIFGPREFIDPMDRSTFIGRFTVEETTHDDFAYPGNSTPATDPHNSGLNGIPPGPTLMLADGKVKEYAYTNDQNQRRGEDIVLTNVHSFDIQVWDEMLNQFVNLGHNLRNTNTNKRGWYHREFYKNPDFSNDLDGDPLTAPSRYSYDTWHPFRNSDGSIEMPPTPFRPLGDNSENQPDPLTLDNLGLGSELEVPLRGIRILIRFYDVGSDSMRDLTFTFPLID